MIHTLLVRIWGWLSLPDWFKWSLVGIWAPRYRVAVASILLNDEGQILLCKHTYRKGYPWGLPGGSIQAGEDPERAMEREISEETGLSVRIERPLMVLRTPDRPQITVLYLCTPTGGEFHPNAEVSCIQYFHHHALPETLLPSERQIILEAFALLNHSTRSPTSS